MAVVGVPAVTGLTSLALEAAEALEDQSKLNNQIKDHPYSDPNPDRVPSPDPSFSANSPLEQGDILSPLERLLDTLFSLEYLAIVTMLLILFLFTYGYIQNYTSKIFHKFVMRYIPSKFIPASWRYTIFYNKIVKYNTHARNISLIFFIIILFLIHFLSIYICYKLKTNIDDFVQVYNYLKGIDKSLILLTINYRYTGITNTNLFNIIYKHTLYSISLLKFKYLNVINYQFYIF